MLGIEIYKGRPIFYGMGDFVFQPEQAEHFPSETYEAYGLGDDARPEDIRNAAVAKKEFFHQREPWEAFAAVLSFRGGALHQVRIVPMDLGFDRPTSVRGMPRYAGEALGRRILDYVGEMSRRYGTAIRYVEGENAGLVDLSARGDRLNEG